MKRRIEVLTGAYERSHGRTPRGRGYWLFSVVNPDGERRGPDGRLMGWDYAAPHNLLPSFYGTFTEARRAAVAFCREHGITTIYVGP